jgi:hypothetical protein
MEKKWILLMVLLMFLIYIFLFWRLTSGYAKKEYGKKMWKHWPSQLSYWQAAILYSLGFTAITLFLLKWGQVLTF